MEATQALCTVEISKAYRTLGPNINRLALMLKGSKTPNEGVLTGSL